MDDREDDNHSSPSQQQQLPSLSHANSDTTTMPTHSEDDNDEQSRGHNNAPQETNNSTSSSNHNSLIVVKSTDNHGTFTPPRQTKTITKKQSQQNHNMNDDPAYHHGDGGEGESETPVHRTYNEFDYYTSASSSTLRHVTRMSKRAALASKKVIWDSNETTIDAAQSAVDQWEHAYNALRGLLVTSAMSAQRLYDAAKVGAMGLEHGILSPVRDWVLMPTFYGVEKLASETICFLQSDQAAHVANESLQLTRQVPYVGPNILAPALVKSAEIIQVAWEIIQYPIPTKQQVRESVDFALTGTKWALTTAGREIFLYMKRADATITRTLSHTQWKVLGSGPYATLDKLNKQEIIDHLCERYLSLTESSIARYELAAHIRAHNLPLYSDLVGTGLLRDRGGALTQDDEWLLPFPSYRRDYAPFLIYSQNHHNNGSSTDEHDDDEDISALWFRLPYQNGEKPKGDVPWVRLTGHDRRRLELKYLRILNHDDMATNDPTISSSQHHKGGATIDGETKAESSTRRRVFFDESALQKPSMPDSGVDDGTVNENVNKVFSEQEGDNNLQSLNVSSGYPTVAKWYIPDFSRDTLVDQKRYSVSFFYGCPKCRQRHEEPSSLHPPLRPKQMGDLCDNCLGVSSENDVVKTTWMASSSAVLSPPPISMVMRPNLWRFHGSGDEVRRAVWFLDTRRHGLQPYGDEAQAVLEDAYWFLKWRSRQLQSLPKRQKKIIDGRMSNDDVDDDNEDDPMDGHALLTVQVPSPDGSELQLVQFTSLTHATASNKGLGGAIAFFKRRVYRGADLGLLQNQEIDDDGCVVDDDIDDEEKSNKDSSTIQGAQKVHQSETLAAPASMFDDVDLVECGNKNSDQDHAEIEEDNVEHLVLIVHGIGEMLRCSVDLVFGLQIPNLSSIVDCCGFLRKNHVEIQSARFPQVYGNGDSTSAPTTGRVEFLPCEWHEAFSIMSQRMATSASVGSARSSNVMMQDISLRTIPQMRSFANDTLMDVLYFMSSEHHDIIIDIVSKEMNAVVQKFRALTGFNGKVSIIGHSLGSIIAWDILDNQDPPPKEQGLRRVDSSSDWEDIIPTPLSQRNSSSSIEEDGRDTPITSHCSPSISRSAKTHASQQQSIPGEPMEECDGEDSAGPITTTYTYPKLDFTVEHAFFLGSPIAVFLMVRNQRKPLSTEFSLNGCKQVYNLFHPYDPVAYRIE